MNVVKKLCTPQKWEISNGQQQTLGYVAQQLAEAMRYKPHGAGFDSRWIIGLIH
jgi:hypothetical protein